MVFVYGESVCLISGQKMYPSGPFVWSLKAEPAEGASSAVIVMLSLFWIESLTSTTISVDSNAEIIASSSVLLVR